MKEYVGEWCTTCQMVKKVILQARRPPRTLEHVAVGRMRKNRADSRHNGEQLGEKAFSYLRDEYAERQTAKTQTWDEAE